MLTIEFGRPVLADAEWVEIRSELRLPADGAGIASVFGRNEPAIRHAAVLVGRRLAAARQLAPGGVSLAVRLAPSERPDGPATLYVDWLAAPGLTVPNPREGYRWLIGEVLHALAPVGPLRVVPVWSDDPDVAAVVNGPGPT